MSAKIYAAERQLHAEEYTFEYLKMMKINVVEVPVRFQRIRATGNKNDLFSFIF